MSALEQSPTINGRYSLLDKLGEGGMAEVWRARDVALGRIVALKILRPQYSNDPNFLARFRREAQAVANLTHSNIVNVFDIGEGEGRHYIVMEYVNGRNLKSLIRDQAPLSVNRALDLAIQVAAAVGHAHRAGIVHRDLKPQNILVDTDGRPKVTDFGIARAMSASSATETGVVLGTAHYMAPEQVAGRATTPASDVYSLGVVLYEMLTGRTPFDADSSVGVAMKHLQDTPAPIQQLNPRVPASVAAVVNRAMSKDPAQRYEDAGAMAVALRTVREWGEQATVIQPAVAPPPAQPPPAAAPTAGFDTMGVFLGMMALVAVLGLIPLWRSVYETYVGPIPALLPGVVRGVIPASVPVLGKPEPELIRVPKVVGLPQADAENQLRAAGFQINIRGTSSHEDIPVSHVIQSIPAPDQLVEPNSTVYLIVSSGPAAVELPKVIGLPADQAEQALRDAGFDVVRQESWGGEVPPGEVLSQDPAGGMRVSRGSRVTIGVSTGPVALLEANLGNEIDLVAADLPKRKLRPGEMLELTLRWRARQPISQNYVVFVHVMPADGPILVQQDRQPVDGAWPTSAWKVDQVVWDTYQLPIPDGTPAGTYQIRVGMYPPGRPALDQRLLVVDAGKGREALNSIIVGELEISY